MRTPLDEHPQEVYKNYWIIRITTQPLSRKTFLYDPAVPSFEKAVGSAYRYSDTSMGRGTLFYDIKKIQEHFRDIGVSASVNVISYHGALNAERHANEFSQTT
jgi:hypothetical protein